MNNIYGYMDPDELVIEREYMENKNEFLRLFTEYEMTEKEHQLNMDDIELKSILMENCSLDDLQIMYEEEEKKDGEKKTGILQAIWNRIVKIFHAIIGKFDKINPDELSEEQKKKRIKLPKLTNLITGVDAVERGSGILKNGIEKYKNGDNFDDKAFLSDIGLKAFAGVTTVVGATGLGVLGKKIEEDINNPDTETEAGPFLLKVLDLKEKFKTADDNFKSSQSLLEKSEGIVKTVLDGIATLITPIAKCIDMAIDLVRKGVDWVKDKVTGKDKNDAGNNDKIPENPKNVEDRSAGRNEAHALKTDIMSFNNKDPFGTIGHEEKSKDGKPITVVTVNDVQTFINNSSKAKFSGDEKTKLDETVNKAKDFMKRAKEKNVDNSKSILIALRESVGIIDNIFEEVDIVDLYPYLYESVDKIYTSLFESLDIEHIDAEYESSNTTIYDDSTSEFMSLLNTL